MHLVKASGQAVRASFFGAALWSTAAAATAEEPLKLADSQLEPVKWIALAGWSSDDHLAAFIAYRASCQALRKGRSSDLRPIHNALLNVCRKATDLIARDSRTARAFFEENFQPVRIARLGERERTL